MRVAWVHPSWRDLVIEHLAADDAARRRFLSRSGLPGVLLALSSAGGAHGARELPLLRADADWDALTERLRHVVPELAADETRALLEALAAVAEDARNPYQRAEVLGVAALVLRWVARSWDRSRRAPDVDDLSAYYELVRLVREPVPTPALDAALVRLAPVGDVDLSRPEACDRLDDWLRLAELALRHRPADLTRAGFPDRYLGELAFSLVRAQELPAHGPTARRVARIARRLLRLGVDVPFVQDLGTPARRVLPPPEEVSAGDAIPPSVLASEDLVARVLRDL